MEAGKQRGGIMVVVVREWREGVGRIGLRWLEGGEGEGLCIGGVVMVVLYFLKCSTPSHVPTKKK